MSSFSSFLVDVRLGIIRYGFPVLLVVGNIGNLTCIVMFIQKRHRKSSCSLYLLSAAIFSVIGLNWSLVTNTYALYQPPDPFSISLALCRIRGFILQSTSVLYQFMILLSCIDRFASTSPRASVRNFSNPKMALKMIAGSTLFWMLMSMHLLILETIENGRCYVFGTYAIFFGFYVLCVFGIILPGFTLLFFFLILKNLKTARARVQPVQGTDATPQNILSKRDMNLLKMVLAEVIVDFILTFLYPICSLYGILTANVPNKSLDRTRIEAFLSFFLITFLFYLNYCSIFYLYLAVSKPFRQELKQLIGKCFNLQQQQRRQGTEVNIVTTAKAKTETQTAT